MSSYLDGRGVFEKLFSAHLDEWDCYQGRELSFLFGLVDARAIVLGTRLGVPFLYSVTSIVAILVAAALLWRLIPRIATRLSVTDAGLIVSLMLATPPVALSSYYYRPSKALVAALLVMVSWQIFRLTAGAKDRSAVSDAALVFVCATLMGLSDREGVFLVVVAIVVVAGLSDLRARSVRLALSGLLLALAVNAFWSFAIGPRLSQIADGFAPDTVTQRVPLGYTFANAHNYASALSLWINDIGYFFGGSGAIGGVACLILTGVAYWMRPRQSPQRTLIQTHRPFLVLLVVSGMLLALYTAMYAKLTSIVWPESRLVYYWIPGMVIIAIVAAGACDSAFAISSRFRTPATLLLGVMMCTSILALPRDEDVVRNGEQRVVIEESGLVRDCMRSAATPIAGYHLTAEGAQACSSVRFAAFGSAGPGPAVKAPAPNPLLYCRRARSITGARRAQPALRSLGP